MSKHSAITLTCATLILAALVIPACQEDLPVSGGGSGKGDSGPVFTVGTNFTSYFDGQAAHNSSNCTSCAGSDFTFNTSATTANIKQDLLESNYCGETNAVLYFDTSNLNVSKCGIQSATFSFYVSSVTGLDVSQMRVRVYAKRGLGQVPATLNSGDFVACGSGYTDLGLATFTGTGWVNFTVPNASSNIYSFAANSQHHWLEFVLVDASVFSTGDGSQLTKITTKEGTNKPTLDVVTYDCFGTCLEGQVRHNEETACDNCEPTELATYSGVETWQDNSASGCQNSTHGAILFDTSSLNDGASISSAKLSFNVEDAYYLYVGTTQLEVFALTLPSPCPSELGKAMFKDCNGNLVSLGTVTISGIGFHTLTIPNPNSIVSKTGITEFILVDDSQIIAPGGYANTIMSDNSDLARFRSRLEIQ